MGVSNDCPKRHRSSKATRIRHIWCVVPLISDAEIFNHRDDARMEQMHPPPTPPILHQFQHPIPCHQDQDVPCHPRKKKTGESAGLSSKDSFVKENDDGKPRPMVHWSRRHDVFVVRPLQLKEQIVRRLDNELEGLLPEPPRLKCCQPYHRRRSKMTVVFHRQPQQSRRMFRLKNPKTSLPTTFNPLRDDLHPFMKEFIL